MSERSPGDDEVTLRPVRVLLADPYSLFRQALRRLLDARPEIDVVAEVRSPGEYRSIRGGLEYDVAIVASDLLTGTRSTAPLHADDYHLDEDEAGGAASPLVIVLVADEDIEATGVEAARGGREHDARRFYVPRSAPGEELIDTIMSLYRNARRATYGS